MTARREDLGPGRLLSDAGEHVFSFGHLPRDDKCGAVEVAGVLDLLDPKTARTA